MGGGRMGDFDTVVSMFLSSITEFGFIDYTEEDLKEELGLKIKIVMAKARVLKDLEFAGNVFSRKLTNQEATLIANGLVLEWISPKVYNVELFKSQLSSKDFTTFSNANRLNSLIELRNNAQIEFNSLLVDYDFDTTDLFDSGDSK